MTILILLSARSRRHFCSGKRHSSSLDSANCCRKASVGTLHLLVDFFSAIFLLFLQVSRFLALAHLFSVKRCRTPYSKIAMYVLRARLKGWA